MTSDDESLDLVTNWIVEYPSFSEKFEHYNLALAKFNSMYKAGKHVILYEIKMDPLNGSTVKRVPLLNSKRTNAQSNKINNKSENKSGSNIKGKKKSHDFKVRMLLLGIVFITFLIIVYLMNILATGHPEVGGTSHFVIPIHFLKYHFFPMSENILLFTPKLLFLI